MTREIVKEDIAKVKALLLQVLGAGEYASLSRMGGLTNHTYHVTLQDGREIPGFIIK